MLAEGSAEACIIDADQPDRDTASDRVAAVRRLYPGLAIIACVDSDQGIVHLGNLGVDGVVFATNSVSGLKADIDAALSTRRAQNVAKILESRIAHPGPEAVAWAMEHAGLNPSVDRLSAALGHTSASLREALQDAGLPRPSRLLLWGRLILAGARLGDDGRRVEDVAFSLGYSTATSFGRAMKIHVGLTPAEVSRKGGLEVVLDALFPPDHPMTGEGGNRSAPDGGRRLPHIASLVILFLTAGCASLGISGTGVDRGAVQGVLDAPPFDQMHVGVLAVDAESGRTLMSHNARRKFIPASNQKVLVTATALSLLGPDYRFSTDVFAVGARNGTELDGDLVVVASGDPSISPRYWTSAEDALRTMADGIRTGGVERVTGSLVVDVSAWDSTSVGPTWEVEDLRYRYGSTGGAFAINEGEIQIVLRAGPVVGSPATMEWRPVGTDDFVRSHVRTVAADSSTRVRPDYLPESRQLVLEGRVPLGTVDTLTFAMRDPVRQATAALARALSEAGVSVEGGWEVRWTRDEPEGHRCRHRSAPCSRSAPLTTFTSPPLSELIAGILEPSQNWMTEQLVRTLGARFGSEGSWEEGLGVMTAYLVNEVGVDPSDVAPRDGSGLSFYNLITPRALVRVLSEMQVGPHAEAYRRAMAEPGEEESTLERRLPELQGRVFAKTGTISNVNSLSGYLVRENGQEVVFSILTNGSGLPASEVRAAVDEIVRILAR